MQVPQALPYLHHVNIAQSQFWAWYYGYYEANVVTWNELLLKPLFGCSYVGRFFSNENISELLTKV